jgi:aryl-alcohol dehydrogenase-like predicted oxidoreductase
MDSASRDRVPLGNTNLQVSRIGVGTMTWGRRNNIYGGTHGAEDEQHAFEASLAAGVNFFDTAEMYGRGSSEERLGEVARGRDAILATKFFPLPPRTTRALPRALDRSLARLGRSSVDLYQIHFPAFWMSIAGLMSRLADAVQAGKARSVGVSNYSEAQMRKAHRELKSRGIPLASNQVQYSLLHRSPESDGVLRACQELGVTLIAYQPLASGALTGKYTRTTLPSDRMRRRFVRYFRSSSLDAASGVTSLLKEIGGRHGRTSSQVALRWLIQHERVVAIPGAKNGSQATENAGALDFNLSADEMTSLTRATSPPG